MAVINSPQIGIARGKLGDAVYYRSKGNTNARSYNPNTTNRRTVRQQTQRSLFSSAVKFFSRGVQNLFVFAYEDKRTQESDYNAFMRYNAKRGMYFGPEQNGNPAYPALGDFILTHGSLMTFPFGEIDNFLSATLRCPTANVEFSTVAELSQALIAGGYYQEGDIFTFLRITSDSLEGSASEPVIVDDIEPAWNIEQIILNSTDARTLASLKFKAYGQDSTTIIIQDTTDNYIDSTICAYAVIHSRLSGGQLKVSDSALLLSEHAADALVYGRAATWKNIVMAAWNTESLSILQGGVAASAPNQDSPELVIAFSLPRSVADLSGQVLQITNYVAQGNWYTGLSFITQGGNNLLIDSVVGNTITWGDGTDNFFTGTWAQSGSSVTLFLNSLQEAGPQITQITYTAP